MKRRIALKNMTLAAGGMMVLPTWAKGWSRTSVTFQSFLLPQEDELLLAMVDTILPATDIPGAKDLEVHLFVQKMITDCYEPEVQESLKKGLEMVEEMAQQSYGIPFSACNTMQKEELLMKLENPLTTEISPETQSAENVQQQEYEFFALVKKLTIRGFMTSEYVMTNHTDYSMMPGHFYGCVSATS